VGPGSRGWWCDETSRIFLLVEDIDARMSKEAEVPRDLVRAEI
jgi:hypothetical protein